MPHVLTNLCQAVPRVTSPYTFSTDSSYLLAGGLGGIGRSVARWMVARGARHLIFLSRSGGATGRAKALTAELEQKGVRVQVFKCDIIDQNHLRLVMASLDSDVPPIKGCVQAAMQLHVRFRTLSWHIHIRSSMLTSHVNRTYFSRTCLTPRSAMLFIQRSKAHGTFTPSLQKTWNFS